ncbi:MAG: Activator of Hsp90 ATPase 1 family protein [Acidimicrobiales bacterium]|nr:Activator of Hsp90 ATPase 1 family protein [Acidimicrobiales bacterium]
MNITDLAELIGRTKRCVVDNGDRRPVVVVRGYDWPISDVWDAWTDQDRLQRWLGELRGTPLGRRAGIGDTVQMWVGPGVSDTATLTILACEAPERLTVRWAAVLDVRDESAAGFEPLLTEVTPLWAEAAASAATDARWPILIDGEEAAAVVVGRTFTQPIVVVRELLTSPASMVDWFGDFVGNASSAANSRSPSTAVPRRERCGSARRPTTWWSRGAGITRISKPCSASIFARPRSVPS